MKNSLICSGQFFCHFIAFLIIVGVFIWMPLHDKFSVDQGNQDNILIRPKSTGKKYGA